jgi:hypothetical protein
VVENSGGVCKKPLVAGQGKTVPGEFCWLLWAEVYPVGRCGPWRGKIPEADGGGRAVPDSGLRRWRCRVCAGFESDGGDLDLLVTDAQHEVMQGVAKDGVGAVVKRLERRYVAVSPHEHRR